MSHTPLDIAWILLCAGLVMLMQAGFCCLESGLVRSKNSINVAFKNFADFLLSSAIFWIFGFALMFGSSHAGLFGTSGFMFGGDVGPWLMAFFLFQMMFCGTATTIVSGAVAERMRFAGYLVVATVLSGLIYPVVGHWVWGGTVDGSPTGWLAARGFVDFAGATVVHSVGGWISLAAIIVIGPRIGRFGPNRTPIHGHDLPLVTLGVFVLWFGWYGFNGGSILRLDDNVPSVLVNTTLSGAFGGLATLGLSWKIHKRPDVAIIMNGALAGLVGITGSANIMTSTASITIGAVAGVMMFFATLALEKLRIDDAVGAFPVHGCGGVWGTLAIPLLSDPAAWGTGLTRWEQLGIQITGVGACFVWAFCGGYVLLLLINRIRPLRIDPEGERRGLNIAEHNASTEILDLLTEMDHQRRSNDFSRHVNVEPHTEVGQIAAQYNRVLDKINAETARREETMHVLETRTKSLDLLRSIAAASNRATSLEEALHTAVDEVCSFMGWPVGHVYMLDERDGAELVPTDIWHIDDRGKFHAFEKITNDWRFKSGVGLPGRVLESGEPRWVSDVTTDPSFLRRIADQDLAVRSGFAFPVLAGDEVAAVLEFFSSDTQEPDDAVLELMASIGTQLGRVVERKQSEEQRFKTTVDNLPAFLFLRDLDGRFMLVNKAYREFYGLGRTPIEGRTLAELFSGSRLELEARRAAKIDHEVIDKRAVVEQELEAKIDGHVYYLSTIRFPIHDVSGQLVAIGGIEIDLTERKRQEEALARATELKDVALRELSAVMNAIDYGILFMDSNTKIIQTNKAYRRIWNIPDSFFDTDRHLRDDLEYCYLQGLYDLSEEEWPAYLERRLAMVRSGDCAPEEFSLSNGKILQYQCFGLADGGLMTTYFDITRLKDTEEALRQSQERLVQALESISEAFALCDANDRMVVLNSRYRRMFFPGRDDIKLEGESFESVIRQNIENRLVRLDGRDPDAFLVERLERHRDPKGPFLQQQTDGRWIQIDESRTRDGGVVAIGTDITELKQAEQAVRESETILKAVVDNIPAVVFLKSIDGRYTLINRKYEEVYGVTYEQVRGRTADEVHDPDRARRFHEKDDEELALRAPVEHEVTIQTNDGERVLSSVLFPVTDENGAMTAFGGIEVDITERNRVAVMLEQAKDMALKATQAKSQFLANMSHELRTPMNAIIGFTRLVMRRSKDRLDPQQYDNLRKIQVSAEHLLSLINDILDLSKIEAGEVTVRPARFELEAVIDDCLRTVEPMAGNRRLSLNKTVEAHVTLYSDEEKVRQILINLLTNAVKFTESGSVTVSVRSRGPRVVVAVVDTGIGIPENKLETIFEEFKQVDESTTRAAGGTGLGLAITRHLVGILGGEIEVRSKLESGSTFSVSLPIRYAPPEPTGPDQHDRIDEKASGP